MRRLALLLFLLAGAADGATISHGNCSPGIGAIAGNAVVNICPGDHFSSAQEALLVASHPTTVKVSNLRFERWFEDGNAPFLAAVLTNSSDVPAIAVTVDVMDTNSGASYPLLRPLKVGESGVFRRVGSRAISLAAGSSTDYPLVSVQDLAKIVHPEVSNAFCPYDASTTLIDRDEVMRVHMEAMVEDMKSNVNAPDVKIGTITSDRPVSQASTLLRIRYRTIFGQDVTAYSTVFIDYADTRFDGQVWYQSERKLDALRCANALQGDFPL